MALNGLKSTRPYTVEVTNLDKHMADIGFFHVEQVLSSHPGGHLSYEEEFTHDEPYGYEIWDDPFDPTGKLTFPLLLFVFGTIFFIHFNFVHFNFLRAKKSEIWMHQRLTAGMLEDKIRHYREAGNI